MLLYLCILLLRRRTLRSKNGTICDGKDHHRHQINIKLDSLINAITFSIGMHKLFSTDIISGIIAAHIKIRKNQHIEYCIWTELERFVMCNTLDSMYNIVTVYQLHTALHILCWHWETITKRIKYGKQVNRKVCDSQHYNGLSVQNADPINILRWFFQIYFFSVEAMTNF